jgi:zinc-finger of acetyl-transferase ESCO
MKAGPSVCSIVHSHDTQSSRQTSILNFFAAAASQQQQLHTSTTKRQQLFPASQTISNLISSTAEAITHTGDSSEERDDAISKSQQCRSQLDAAGTMSDCRCTNLAPVEEKFPVVGRWTTKRKHSSTQQQQQQQQLYLDFGQRNFGQAIICSTCGMLFVHGVETDLQRHMSICQNYTDGVRWIMTATKHRNQNATTISSSSPFMSSTQQRICCQWMLPMVTTKHRRDVVTTNTSTRKSVSTLLQFHNTTTASEQQRASIIEVGIVMRLYDCIVVMNSISVVSLYFCYCGFRFLMAKFFLDRFDQKILPERIKS